MTETESRMPAADSLDGANPVAAILIHALFTALLFACAIQVGLSLVGCLLVAWGGGAGATVALLLAHEAAMRQGAADAHCRDAPGGATAPDL
jgi:hypothetical protein